MLVLKKCVDWLLEVESGEGVGLILDHFNLEVFHHRNLSSKDLVVKDSISRDSKHGKTRST